MNTALAHNVTSPEFHSSDLPLTDPIQSKIVQHLRREGATTLTELVLGVKAPRQAVRAHLQELVAHGVAVPELAVRTAPRFVLDQAAVRRVSSSNIARLLAGLS
jgi:predicted ArsR family transcriptional regulator